MFFGSGASGIVALDAYQKFIRIGKTCNATQDAHIQITLVSNMHHGDVAVAISYSGKTKDSLETAAAAKARGAFVIAITKYGSDNPLAAMADIVLHTTSPEAQYRSGATSSRIAQLTIVDILFAGTASRNIEVYNENLKSSYKHAAMKRLP
ncbi:MAG: SIS domain-containing protein [Oscillospiraceae bacterium]|nr:SIS domain-containing protein [Oscillospiraceae bacterium]